MNLKKMIHFTEVKISSSHHQRVLILFLYLFLKPVTHIILTISDIPYYCCLKDMPLFCPNGGPFSGPREATSSRECWAYRVRAAERRPQTENLVKETELQHPASLPAPTGIFHESAEAKMDVLAWGRIYGIRAQWIRGLGSSSELSSRCLQLMAPGQVP